MAVPANETSFNTRLYADSERTLPDSDLEVLAALETYGVVFKKLKNPAAAAVRIDLLAGLLWAHCHINDLAPALADISTEQHRRLAAALRLDYDKDSQLAHWVTMMSRKILANVAPGSTPLKRKAPDGSLDGQIKKPHAGAPPEQPQLPEPSAKKSKLSKQERRARRTKKALEAANKSLSKQVEKANKSMKEMMPIKDYEEAVAYDEG